MAFSNHLSVIKQTIGGLDFLLGQPKDWDEMGDYIWRGKTICNEICNGKPEVENLVSLDEIMSKISNQIKKIESRSKGIKENIVAFQFKATEKSIDLNCSNNLPISLKELINFLSEVEEEKLKQSVLANLVVDLRLDLELTEKLMSIDEEIKLRPNELENITCLINKNIDSKLIKIASLFDSAIEEATNVESIFNGLNQLVYKFYPMGQKQLSSKYMYTLLPQIHQEPETKNAHVSKGAIGAMVIIRDKINKLFEIVKKIKELNTKLFSYEEIFPNNLDQKLKEKIENSQPSTDEITARVKEWVKQYLSTDSCYTSVKNKYDSKNLKETLKKIEASLFLTNPKSAARLKDLQVLKDELNEMNDIKTLLENANNGCSELNRGIEKLKKLESLLRKINNLRSKTEKEAQAWFWRIKKFLDLDGLDSRVDKIIELF